MKWNSHTEYNVKDENIDRSDNNISQGWYLMQEKCMSDHDLVKWADEKKDIDKCQRHFYIRDRSKENTSSHLTNLKKKW